MKGLTLGRKKRDSGKKNSQDRRDDCNAAKGLEVRSGWMRTVEFFRGTLAGQAICCLVFMISLYLSFAPFDLWFLAYVALVPFVLTVAGQGISVRRSAMLGAAAGLAFWSVSLYWLWWVTLVGYFAAVIYLTLYFVALAILFRAMSRRRWPMTIFLPILWVAMEYARSWIISGFPWFYLAHTQYTRTSLIQIADVTGQYGVSFFVAMANGVVLDIFRMLPRLAVRMPSAIVSVVARVILLAVAGAGLLVYGGYRIGQYASVVQDGPKIGIVQCAVPISLSGKTLTPDDVFEKHMSYSVPLVSAKCDLIVWPETMMPLDGMNADFIETDLNTIPSEALKQLAGRMMPPEFVQEYFDRGELKGLMSIFINGGRLFDKIDYPGRLGYARQIGDLSQMAGCPVLVGATTLSYNPNPVDQYDWWQARNSALVFSQTWKSQPGYYSKMHLVPFSEYVPFRKSAPWLYRILRWFVPDAMMQLVPGESIKRMEIESGERKFRFAVPICYEGTFDGECRRMVYENGNKAADILVNISNDGWFFWLAMDHASTENAQHLSHYCFRAVENRVPVVRSVNTGISASIDSCGRIVAAIGKPGDCYGTPMAEGSLLLGDAAGVGRGAEVVTGPKILIDTRKSIYGQIADIFAQAVLAIAIMAVGAVFFCDWREKAMKK